MIIEGNKDAKELCQQFFVTNNDKYRFKDFCSFYFMTTENIKGYNQFFNYDNKRVLTVCGSGDQTLNAILNGAKTVNVFDINKAALYHLLLKKTAIEYLSRDEFMHFYESCLSKYHYDKIKPYLDVEVRAFFDYLYLFVYGYRGLEDLGIYLRDDMVYSDMYDVNEYCTSFGYSELQHNLAKAKINLFHSNLLSLSDKLDEQYDIMLFSNIFDYLLLDAVGVEKFNIYRQYIIDHFNKNLSDEGQILLSYAYSEYPLLNKDNQDGHTSRISISNKYNNARRNHCIYVYKK